MANYSSKFTGADLDRSISIAKDSVADEFSTSTSYAIGDLVIYGDATNGYDLYKCIEAHSGAWVASHFSKITLAEAISNAGKVIGVKGNAESDYRTGNVNLTPANIGAQETLVSGTNIKSINSNSILGSGNLSLQETLVSGTNIKTINNTSLLGSGNVAVQSELAVNPATTTSTLTGLTINGTSYAIEGGGVKDVQVDGTTIVSSGVANLTGSNAPAIDAAKVTSGTFADERIASAATWNAKQDAITSSTDLAVKTLTGGLTYVTEAPTADNTDGIKIAVLSTEPSTKYDGWLYLITSA